MISRDELDQVACDRDISLANVECDYVSGWLISGLFQTRALPDTIVLKGSNVLRKGYFPLTRFSDDLDFSTASGLVRARRGYKLSVWHYSYIAQINPPN